MNVTAATKTLEGMSVADKNELLFQHGINFNEVPNWQKRGVGLYWETYDKPGFNPKTGQTVMAERRRVKVDYELPMKEAYGEFVLQLLAQAIAEKE
jgi:tRNA(His) 5'-end guanylyltransferase